MLKSGCGVGIISGIFGGVFTFIFFSFFRFPCLLTFVFFPKGEILINFSKITFFDVINEKFSIPVPFVLKRNLS